MFTKKSIIVMSIIISVLIVFIAGLLIWRNYPSHPGLINQIGKNGNNAASTSESSIEAGKKATGNLIEEAKKLAEQNGPGNIAQVINVDRTNSDGTKTPDQAVVVAPQSNPISVTTGEVLTRDGTEVAKAGTRAGDFNAPIQSAPIDASKLPASAVKLVINSNSVSPAEFTVNAGQAVVLSITAASSPEVFRFESSLLAAVAVGLEKGQTLMIDFNAPTVAGDYIFYSDFASHRQMGVVGKMVVK
jgi:cytoskeletal protein RodZ